MTLENYLKQEQPNKIAILMFGENGDCIPNLEYTRKEYSSKQMSKELLAREVMDTQVEDDLIEIWVM